jgi:hypothetical protein
LHAAHGVRRGHVFFRSSFSHPLGLGVSTMACPDSPMANPALLPLEPGATPDDDC